MYRYCHVDVAKRISLYHLFFRIPMRCIQMQMTIFFFYRLASILFGRINYYAASYIYVCILHTNQPDLPTGLLLHDSFYFPVRSYLLSRPLSEIFHCTLLSRVHTSHRPSIVFTSQRNNVFGWKGKRIIYLFGIVTRAIVALNLNSSCIRSGYH